YCVDARHQTIESIPTKLTTVHMIISVRNAAIDGNHALAEGGRLGFGRHRGIAVLRQPDAVGPPSSEAAWIDFIARAVTFGAVEVGISSSETERIPLDPPSQCGR